MDRGTAIVFGTVVDFDDNPVPYADLGILGEGRPLARLQADDNGVFSVPWPSEGSTLWFDADGYVQNSFDLSAYSSGGRIELRVRLARSTSPAKQQSDAPGGELGKLPGVKATVTDAQGSPVAGVRVWKVDFRGAQSISSSGPRGEFSIAICRGTRYLFDHPEFAPLILDAAELARRESIPVRLHLGGTLRVQVSRGDRPVEGICVELRFAWNVRQYKASTDAEGTVQFNHVPEDWFSLNIPDCPDDFGVFGVTSIREGALSECQVKIFDTYPGVLRGKIASAEGPVKGAMLLLSTPQEFGGCCHPVNGATPVPELVVDPPRRCLRHIPVGEDGNFEVGLRAGVTVVTAHLDGETGWAVLERPRRCVTIDDARRTAYEEFWLEPIRTRSTIRVIGTDPNPAIRPMLFLQPGLTDNGQSDIFLETTDGTTVVEARRGQIILAYDQATKMLGWHGLEVGNPLPPAEIELRLDSPASAIQGVVRDRDGRPMPRVMVAASGKVGPQLPIHRRRAQTNSLGRYRLSPLISGETYSLIAERHGFASVPGQEAIVTAQTEPADTDIQMLPCDAHVSGRVVNLQGSPIADASVTLTPPGQPLVRGSGHMIRPIIFTARTNSAGEFSLSALPGPHTAVARFKGKASAEAAVSAPSRGIVLTVPVSDPVLPPEDEDIYERRYELSQLAMVHSSFASKHAGWFPEIVHTQGVFAPDSTNLYSTCHSDPAMVGCMGRCWQDVKWCYTGYLLTSEEHGNAFLDAYEEWGPRGLGNADIELSSGKKRFGSDRLFRLRDGIERFLIADISNPNASQAAQATIPVTWEMPNETDGGGWVLYMDGHVEWQPYPGEFPMAESFIGRIRSIAARNAGS